MTTAAEARRRTLRELLAHEVLRTEADVLAALRRRGFNVTQATVSRDLSMMGAAKVSTAGGARYVLRDTDDARGGFELALLEITSIVANESIVVVKTRVGHASGVGVFLDGLRTPDILGTLAGNDTVLVIPDSHEHTSRLLAYLRDLVYARTAAHPAGAAEHGEW